MARYLTSGMHPITGCNRPQVNARERVDRPRLGLYAQYWHWDTKAEIDTLVDWMKDVGVTDFFPLILQEGSSPYQIMGYAGSCNTHLWATTADGSYLLKYLARLCEPLGIKVHVWWCIYFWAWWGATSSPTNTRLDAAYHDLTGNSVMVKLFEPVARDFILDVLWDLAWNNTEVSGVHLDYIRADGYSTAHIHSDITAFVQEGKARFPDREFSVASTARPFQERSGSQMICQRARDWAANKYINMCMMMGYVAHFGHRGEQIVQMSYNNGVDVMIGMSVLTGDDRGSDLAERFRAYQHKGYRHFCLFDAASTSWLASEYTTLAKAIHINGNLDALYPNAGNITKIGGTQGTNVIINIGGSEKTITWAQLGLPTELDPGDIKDNAESAAGVSLKPFLFNTDDTDLILTCGDWYNESG